jgi:hypothetical protein
MKASSYLRLLLSISVGITLMGFAACRKQADAPAAVASPFIVTASIQDIMSSIVDPSADYLWQSVSIVTNEKGTEHHQPRTDEEWAEARKRAITLIESANLLAMEGRRVVEPGKKLEDEGVPGVLSAAESQKLVDADRANFAAHARGLHAAATVMLKAIDAKDANALLEAGGPLYDACEVCHLKYWYPDAGVPDFTK